MQRMSITRNIKLSREQKWIITIGGILLVMASIYRFYPTIQEAASVSDEAAVKIKQIQKYKDVIAKKKGLTAEKKRLENRLDKLEASLLSGSTPSLAAVNLQDFIKKISDAEGIDIRSIRVLGARSEKEQSYILIPVTFTFRSNTRQLKNLLYQIENSPDLLIIKELSVKSLMPARPGEIEATITVEGVMPKNGAPKG
jgi:hypothetical protein